MRVLSWILAVIPLAGCYSDFEGDSYPQVADFEDVLVVDEVPEGARIIGYTSDRISATPEGLIETIAACNAERRLTRQMKRAAAAEGGEFLVGLHCEFDDGYEDGERYCETFCEADVARHWIHDE